MILKLTILGKYGPYPKGAGACSGYLIEWNNNKLLLDCGNGVLSRYFGLGYRLNELTGIIISHLHPDHFSDLLVLRYALQIDMAKGKAKDPMLLYCPSNPTKFFEELNYKGVFNINTINDKQVIEMQGLKIEFNKTKHPVECYSTTIYNENKKFVYTGDTEYFEGIEDIVKNSNVLLCEGGILESQKTNTVPHLSAREACEIAQRAKVKRLILTHMYPGNNHIDLLEEGNKYYSGILEAAKEKSVYYI